MHARSPRRRLREPTVANQAKIPPKLPGDRIMFAAVTLLALTLAYGMGAA
jgi:hypothetical protein